MPRDCCLHKYIERLHHKTLYVAIMVHPVDTPATPPYTPWLRHMHTDALFMRRIHARPAQAAREFEGREPMAAAIIIYY